MIQRSLINAQILQNTWNFIKQQARLFDVWFGLCGLVLVFGLIFSCALVMAVATVISVLVVINPIALVMIGGALSILIALSAVVLGIVLLNKVGLWGFGFLNAVAVNALDAAQGRSLRRFQNRVTGLIYFMGLVIYFLVICMGLSFFIIPGIVFAVRFSLARYAMLEQGCTIWQALMSSWDMTRGYFWTLLALYSILLVLYMIPLVFLIDLFFPVSNLCMASLYVQLQRRQLTPDIVFV